MKTEQLEQSSSVMRACMGSSRDKKDACVDRAQTVRGKERHDQPREIGRHQVLQNPGYSKSGQWASSISVT